MKRKRRSSIMRVTLRRTIVAVVVTTGICVGAVYVTGSRIEADVDPTIAQLTEQHTCPHCGNVFDLSISEATAMRRQHGEIVCPKCGKLGARKEAGANAGDLIVNQPRPTDTEDEDAGEVTTPKRRGPAHTPVGPAMKRETEPDQNP